MAIGPGALILSPALHVAELRRDESAHPQPTLTPKLLGASEDERRSGCSPMVSESLLRASLS
jgi:hypothetical protein